MVIGFNVPLLIVTEFHSVPGGKTSEMNHKKYCLRINRMFSFAFKRPW